MGQEISNSVTFTDFIDQPLAVGDRVVHGVGGRYAGLSGPYYVHSFTPKMVRIARQPYAEKHYSIVPSSNLVKVPLKGDEWEALRDAHPGENLPHVAQ